MPPTKRSRSASKIAPAKRSRTSSTARTRPQPDAAHSLGNAVDQQDDLRKRFMDLFVGSEGVANSKLKRHFGPVEYPLLVPIINELTQASRLDMSRVGDELYYNLVSEDLASKFSGLDASARMVYQVIEKSGNLGIWTKEIRTRTNLQQQALNKIFKALEGRQLIKPVKSVSNKKVYMLYNLTPAKELTGGPWYTELEFDHEFIHEMRKFLLKCVKCINNGQGITLEEIAAKMIEANVSKVQLNLEEVQQLLQTLVYDSLVETNGVNTHGEVLFVTARRVTPMCEFKWWEGALSPDFHFRTIRFEDGVTLEPHEPHHHTA